MASLEVRDVRALLAFLGECYGCRGLDELRPQILPGLRRLIPCELAAYNEIQAGFDDMIVFADPAEALFEGAAELFLRYGHQNVLVRHYQGNHDGRPRKWSDFITRRELHATELYQQLYAPAGVEYQMACQLPAAPTLLIGLTVNRQRRDFSERDRTLLNLARPGLIQAYANAREREELSARLSALERGVEDGGRGLAVLGAHDRVEFASSTAKRVLGEGSLPEPVRAWIAETRARADEGPAPLLLDAEGNGRVLVRLLPAPVPGEPDALLVESPQTRLDTDALGGMGLTARQAEVLRLAAEGADNRAIATALGISPRTVEKHLAAIYDRLGVQTRGAAVATAWAGVAATGT